MTLLEKIVMEEVKNNLKGVNENELFITFLVCEDDFLVHIFMSCH